VFVGENELNNGLSIKKPYLMIFHPPWWRLEYELGIAGDTSYAPNKHSIAYFFL